jgi:hypothetical protein
MGMAIDIFTVLSMGYRATERLGEQLQGQKWSYVIELSSLDIIVNTY